MSTAIKTVQKSHLTLKAQALATVAAVASAIVLPWIVHFIGSISGMGTSLGEALLPMHLPIILVGLLAGQYAGAVSGVFAVLLSFALTGMPKSIMLPFMVIELCAYGFFAGLLRNVKMPNILKVLTVQVLGRAIRALTILLSVYLFKNGNVEIAVIWKSIITGASGICLQLILIPLVINRVENLKKNES